RKVADLALEAREQRRARTAPPRSFTGAAMARRNCPVRDEAAKVVDPHRVDQLERAAEALDPPAVAVACHHCPVVDRIPPTLSRRAPVVGRDTGDEAPPEQLRSGPMIGASAGDSERKVAEDPDAAVTRVCVHGVPLALEANLIVDRALTRVRGPVVD